MIDLRDEAECRDVVSRIQSLISGATWGNWAESSANWPKGCFYIDNLFYWNKHPTGNRCNAFYNCNGNVCKQGT